MKVLQYLVSVCISICFGVSAMASKKSTSEFIPVDRGRLIVLADMGNEPDEEQQIMHLLMCSNEMDIEGLVAVTGKFLNPNSNNPSKQKLYPELFNHLIEGYSKVYKNLTLHAINYPHPDSLSKLVVEGQKGYGMQDVGDGKTSAGSEIILRQALNDDPRPLYIVVNAGSNTLAQALYDYNKHHTDKEMESLISRLRVYENGAQDEAGAWICHHYPQIFWIRSNYQTYCYAGPGIDGGINNKGDGNELGPHYWQPYPYSGIGQHQWLLENIIGNHGPFGKYYPLRQFPGGGISFMEGGGTIPWLCLVTPGLSDIEHPHWGSWSGRFSRSKFDTVWSKHHSVRVDEVKYVPFKMFTEVSDSWSDNEPGVKYNNHFAPVFRWRKAFYNDFMCRMDWCKGKFVNANHHPVAWLNGDGSNAYLKIQASPESIISLSANGSVDPDGDSLNFYWFHYAEPGSNQFKLDINNSDLPDITFKVPEVPAGTEIHIILEVSDLNSIASLYDYRRIIVQVK